MTQARVDAPSVYCSNSGQFLLVQVPCCTCLDEGRQGGVIAFDQPALHVHVCRRASGFRACLLQCLLLWRHHPLQSQCLGLSSYGLRSIVSWFESHQLPSRSSIPRVMSLAPKISQAFSDAVKCEMQEWRPVAFPPLAMYSRMNAAGTEGQLLSAAAELKLAGSDTWHCCFPVAPSILLNYF